MTPDAPSDETFVRLTVTSEVRTSEDISAVIGMSPDRSWRIGDRRSGSAIIERSHGWVIESRNQRDIPFDTHLAAVLDRAVPFAERFQSLRGECAIELLCAVYSYSVNPGVHFPLGTIAAIHAIGAALDLDLYTLAGTLENS